MIYDCFTFFNELDLLEIRLNVLKDVVDRFVLVEAGETHTGKPKPFLFEANRERFAEFASRIKYIKIEKFPACCKTPWWRENLQRNAIAEGLSEALDDDIILISDLDEIPRPDKIRQFATRPGVKVFDQCYYSFYLNYRNVRQQYWYGTRMVSYRDFKHAFDGVSVAVDEFLPLAVNVGTTASKLRCRKLPRARGGHVIIRGGGWHFTCLGGAKAVVEKMRAVAPHHDFDSDDPALTETYVAGLLARGVGPGLKMNCFAVLMDDGFPVYLRENLARYGHLLFPVSDEYLRLVRWACLFRTIQGKLIQFAEWGLMATGIHRFLHRVRMRVLSWKGAV